MTAARWRMAASWAATVMPSIDICSIPARCFFSSVATRTMKNSSRFDDDDRQELHALEQRMVVVERLIEHALVELQPAQLPIAVQRRVVEGDGRGRASDAVAWVLATCGARIHPTPSGWRYPAEVTPVTGPLRA